MATAILSSRNSFNHRLDHESLIPRKPNSRLTKPPRRVKRSPTPMVVSPAANTNLVMGQVKILKRGETLSAFRDKESNSCDDKKRPVLRMSDVDLVVTSTNRIGPEPETVQNQIGVFKGLEIVPRGFAGACSSLSPPPSSVPIPCFLGKN